MGKRKERRSEVTETLNNSNGEDEDTDGRSEDSEDGEKSGFFSCYLLTSLCPRFKGHTYIGFTVNPRRRIRQHNGEICSGAFRTKKKRPWEMVFCIYGFPTNVAALQFEWAWQHPVESLAVRHAAVGFKSLGGLANKIKLAYTMLTLPAWNNLNLTVNFFSTKYTKHYAGCPSLPSHMRVDIRSMDELPCYTEGEDDTLRFKNCSWDDDDEEQLDRPVGSCHSEATFSDATIPVLVSKEADIEHYEQLSCSNDCNDSPERLFRNTTVRPINDLPYVSVLDMEDHKQPSCSKDYPGWLFRNTQERSTNDLPPVFVLDIEDHEQPSCINDSPRRLFRNTRERSANDLPPVFDLDIEDHEPSCSKDSPGWLFRNTQERSRNDLPPVTIDDENTKMDGSYSGEGMDVDGPGTKILASSGEVEVIDLFTPSPVLRTKSKSRILVNCPEIIDLTQSPMYV